ncbi:MAG: hypothetical protein ACJA06_002243 [Halocynthiibacter sp.]|jgi:hypothetical protein
MKRVIFAIAALASFSGPVQAAGVGAKCVIDQVCPVGSACIEPKDTTVMTLSSTIPPRFIAEVAGVVFGALEVAGDAPNRRDFVGRSPTGTAYLISIVPRVGMMATAHPAVPGVLLPVTMTGTCEE